MTTIGNDVDLAIGDDDVTEAAEAFLKTFVPPDAAKPSVDKPEPQLAKATEPEIEPSKDAPVEGDEAEVKPEPEKQFAADDSYFKVKIGDEEHEVTAKDLKRLYGQEVALTKRSQEVALQRKKADEETTKAVTSLDLLLKRSQERAAPYKAINFLTAAQELPPDQLDGLRKAAMQAFEEEHFLQTELKGFIQTVQAKQEETLAAKAEEALTQLSDPASPYFIDDWSDGVYDELREFAVGNGLDQAIVDQLTDAPVFKLLRDAMLYQRGAKNVVTKKVDKTPTKIMKTSAVPSVRDSIPDKEKQLTARLRQSGETDDAAELFMARWARNTPQD